jgi:plastocyanin
MRHLGSGTCAALVAALLLAALADARPAVARSPAPPPTTVLLKDSFFSPSRVTVFSGRRVRFVWAGRLVHNLVGPGVPRRYATPVLRRTPPFERRFVRIGVQRFVCSIHPGMAMTVRVR